MVSTTRRVLSLLLVLCVLGVPAAFAQAPSVVHGFDGVAAGQPAAGLTLGADGFLYGTSETPAPYGAVFRVRPDGSDFAVLHTFTVGGGGVPSHAALARGPNGVFYGTTRQGGAGGGGTVYQLEVGSSGARVTTLHAFAAPDADPDGGVILASDGLLYGTFGNDLTAATVYRLATDGTAFEYLRALPTGYRPTGTLLEGSDGLLYGTTERGGVNDGGTVFRLSRNGADYTALVELEGNPVAGLTEAPGPDGTPHLFGVETTGQTPVTEFGAIFQLRPTGAAFLRIAGFTASAADGDTPRSPLLRGRDGALYGTATSERIGCLPENCGTVFRVTPSGRPFSLFTFSPVAGGVPMGALVQGPDGTLYGTARIGGPAAIGPGTGHGVVFAVPEPDRVPLAFTGPVMSDEGADAAYVLTLRNTTNHTLAGPLTVLVTTSPGLVFTDQSVDDWNCTQPQAFGLVCVWPNDLAPEVESAPHELRFTLTAPFTADCGTGPSPCVAVTVVEPDSGGTARVVTTARTLSGGGLNTPPTPQDDTAPVYGEAPAILRVLDNDTDPDGDALRVTRLLDLPRFGDATINADGTITYTPAFPLFEPDTFRYEVSDERVPVDGRASAVVTVSPTVPTLTSSKERLDLGPLAPGRIASARFYLRSPVAMQGQVVLESVTGAEIATALQGTAHDPALAVSDPGAFRAGSGFSVDPAYPFFGLVMLHYQAPPTLGRVSVAKARLIGEPLGLAPLTHTVLIVASSADPATAPPRAVDDTTATPVQTEVWYDVLANDGGVSVEGRRLYVSSVGCMDAFPDTDCLVPPGMSATQALPASITGPQEMKFLTTSTVTGTATVMYAVSELDACVDAQQSGFCNFEGNMYYGYLSVDVGGTPPDLSLALAPAASTVVPGETVTLTATVTNHGPGMASRVTVSGFAALTQLNGLVVTPSQGTCAIATSGSPLTCTLGNLLQGASATITLQGTAPATLIPAGATSATLDVAAAVSFGNADSQPGNNTAQAVVTVDLAARLPSIDFGRTTYVPCCEGTAPGPAGTITVTLERQGDLSRESTVTYTLSAGPAPSASPEDIVGGFVSGSVTFAVNQVFAGITILTTPDSLDEPDEHVLLTLTGATGATLTRTSLSVTIEDDDLPQRSADVSLVSLTATPSVVDEMQPVRIVASIYNAFVGDATNVTFSGLDAIVGSHIIDSVTPSQGTCAPVVQGSPVRCSLGSMLVWGTATVTVVARPTSNVFLGASQLTADVTMNAVVGADEADPSPANNTGAGAFRVRRRSADLSLTASLADTQVTEGGTTTATLRVLNAGPDAADGTVRVALPATSAVVGAAAGYDLASQIWTFGPVPPGGETALALTVRFDALGSAVVAGEILTASRPDPDSTPGNGLAAGEDDAAGATLLVVARRPNLRAFKVVLDAVGQQVSTIATTEGARVVFQIGAVNEVTGGMVGPTTGVVTLTDTLPSGLVFIATASDPRCSAVGQVVTCVDGAVVPAGGTVRFAVATSVQTGLSPGDTVSLYNAAVVSTPDDVVPDDNTSYAVTITVTRPAEADLALGVNISATSIAIGQPVTITAVVTNLGPRAATGVTLTGFQEVTAFDNLSMSTTQGRCPTLFALGQPVRCTLGTVAPGGTVIVTITGTAASRLFTGGTGSSVPVSVDGTVAANEIDPQLGNNAAAGALIVVWPADVTASNARFTTATSPGPVGLAVVGDTLNYRVTVSNIGGPTSGPVTVRTTMAGMVPVNLPSSCTAPAPFVVSCTISALQAGASADVGFWLTIGPGAVSGPLPTPVPATTTVSTPGETSTGNNTIQTLLTIVNRANLRVRSAAFTDRSNRPLAIARVGDMVVFTVVIENAGQVDSPGVDVAMMMAGGRVDRGGFCPGRSPIDPATVVCRTPAIRAGQSMTMDVAFEIMPFALPGGQASALTAATATILDLSRNTGQAAIRVIPPLRPPDLIVAGATFTTLGGAPVTGARVGDVVLFTTEIRNVGDRPSSRLRLNAAMFGGNIEAGGTCGAPGFTTTVDCSVAAIDPGGVRVVSVAFRIEAYAVPSNQFLAVLTATATVREALNNPGPEDEVNLSNNSRSERLTVSR